MNDSQSLENYFVMVRRMAVSETQKFLKTCSSGEFDLMMMSFSVSSEINENHLGPAFPYQAIEAYLVKTYVVVERNGVRYFNPEIKTN